MDRRKYVALAITCLIVIGVLMWLVYRKGSSLDSQTSSSNCPNRIRTTLQVDFTQKSVKKLGTSSEARPYCSSESGGENISIQLLDKSGQVVDEQKTYASLYDSYESVGANNTVTGGSRLAQSTIFTTYIPENSKVTKIKLISLQSGNILAESSW